MAQTRIHVPARAAAGEIVELRAMVSHPMETGFRIDESGNNVPMHIVTDFACSFEGEEIFRARLQPGIAANPYLSFYARATRSGTFRFDWVDADGSVYSQSGAIIVEG